jgi:hypothetical protein
MYNWGYGLEDNIDNVLVVIKDTTLKKVVLNKKGKTIPIEKTETWTTTKSIRGSQKKGCQHTFMLKMFYLLLLVT